MQLLHQLIAPIPTPRMPMWMWKVTRARPPHILHPWTIFRPPLSFHRQQPQQQHQQ